jgi:hypothetical protein
MNILIIVVDVPWSDFISELYAIAVEGAWSLRFAPERCICGCEWGGRIMILF